MYGGPQGYKSGPANIGLNSNRLLTIYNAMKQHSKDQSFYATKQFNSDVTKKHT